MSPDILGFLGGAFLVSYLLALFTDRRLSNVFSQFWHVVQPKLLLTLKRARKSGINSISKSMMISRRLGGGDDDANKDSA
jgi:hypothetical protein